MKLLAFFLLVVPSSVVDAQCVPAVDTVAMVNNLSTMSSSLETLAKAMTRSNGIESGITLLQGFYSFVNSATADYIEMNQCPAGSAALQALLMAHADSTYTHGEQASVCNAFFKFVKVHQAALVTIIGKSGLVDNELVARDMSAVLHANEEVISLIASTLVDEVPDCAVEAKKHKQSLDSYLSKAVDAYSHED